MADIIEANVPVQLVVLNNGGMEGAKAGAEKPSGAQLRQGRAGARAAS